MIRRYTFLLAIACQLLLLTAATIAQDSQPTTDSNRATPSQRPNIVVILADDMGYGDVHALNPDSKIPTPYLDQLAASGMTFSDGHSASAVCTPTRYSLLTGRYSWRTPMKRGVLGGYGKPMIKPDRATIATMLKRAGYKTGAVGKWHLGMQMPLLKGDAKIGQWEGDPGIDWDGVISDSPIHHGFDFYFGVSASLDMAPYVYIRNDRFTMKPTEQQPAVKFSHFVRKGPKAADFEMDGVLDRLVEEANGFIQRESKSEEPYFLYVPFTAPHKPTQPKPEFKGKTELGEYGDFIAQVDDSVGQILKVIDDSGKADNTLVVFTSDNGSYMNRFDDDRRDHTDDDTIQGFRATSHRANGPWRGTKADIYEAGHHVPFFVRWNGKVKAGSKADQVICQTDLFATFAEIVGKDLADNEAEDSFSLLAAMQGKEFKRGAPVIHQSGSGMLAIRKDNWKVIAGNGSGGRQKPKGKNNEKPYQLFDLQKDPTESKDLAEEHPDVLHVVDEILQSYIRMGSRKLHSQLDELPYFSKGPQLLEMTPATENDK